MRTLTFFLSQLTRTRTRIRTTPFPSSFHHHHRRSLHQSHPPPPPPPPSSQILHLNPNPTNSQPESESESVATTNEFLSRFVHSIRPILAQSYPDLNKQTVNSMLLLICQRVVAEIDGGYEGQDSSTLVELSDDLWKTITEVSKSVNESMRRDRMRQELKKYLHCDELKQMCRFANDIGLHGDMLREFRFKWAREKMEEVEFYRDLEKLRETASKEEEEGVDRVNVESLPERKGKIRYKIYGLDLSEPEWGEVAERVEEAEGKYVKEEAKEVVGRSKRIEDKFFGLDSNKEDWVGVLQEWEEAMEARRVDWLALLERIKERNLELYFKVAEHLLVEESFDPNICDYSRLIDAHSKSDRFEDAERILTKMTENGIESDVLTSTILVHMYSKSGDLDRAKNAFDSLRKQGFQPDLKVYTSMITAYVKARHPKQGETLILDMGKQNIKPTKEICMDLLRAYAEEGLFDGVQRIMNTMQFEGIPATFESTSLLVEAYGKAGDPDQARTHFDQMLRSGHKPDDRCTASMMTAYLKKNLLDKALNLLLTLQKDGFKPGIRTNTVLVDWLGRLQLVEEAEKVVEEMKTMGDLPLEVHVSLLDIYSRAGNLDKARKSLKILEERKKLMRGDQFERIVSGLLVGKMVEEAKRIYHSMESVGFSPSEPLRMAFTVAQSSFSRQRSGKRR